MFLCSIMKEKFYKNESKRERETRGRQRQEEKRVKGWNYH